MGEGVEIGLFFPLEEEESEESEVKERDLNFLKSFLGKCLTSFMVKLG